MKCRAKAENAKELIGQVVAGSEQMSASIREISETMSKSKANAAEADRRRGSAIAKAQRPGGDLRWSHRKSRTSPIRPSTPTDTISKEIEQLNSVAGDVAGSLTAIKAAIAGVNEFISSTAAAVEEQSIVTQDMSSNMQRASAELS